MVWDAGLCLDVVARKKIVAIRKQFLESEIIFVWELCITRVAVISAKNHKRQRRKRQSVTAKRGKSQTPKVLPAILTLPNLT